MCSAIDIVVWNDDHEEEKLICQLYSDNIRYIIHSTESFCIGFIPWACCSDKLLESVLTMANMKHLDTNLTCISHLQC